MKIRIYGAGDDLIEVEGCEGADEFNSYERGPVMWSGVLCAPSGERMGVRALYDGCWSVAVGQVDDGAAFPAWPLTIAQHRSLPYSTMAEIDAPDGTVLENVWPSRDND